MWPIPIETAIQNGVSKETDGDKRQKRVHAGIDQKDEVGDGEEHIEHAPAKGASSSPSCHSSVELPIHVGKGMEDNEFDNPKEMGSQRRG